MLSLAASPTRARAALSSLVLPLLAAATTATTGAAHSSSSPPSSGAPAAMALSPASGGQQVPPLTAGVLADRLRGALYGELIADALAMPAHWYYSTADLDRDFGRITDYVAPRARHPSSIMSLSNTGGAGRGGQAGSVIGDVINHGKKGRWGVPGVHYHEGMAAGDNTLNALCARLLARTIASTGRADPTDFLAAYVAFMTTPGSHNDTYAESFHRIFFANWARGVPPAKCAGDDGHNIASAGGLVLPPAAALFAAVAAGGPTLTPAGLAAGVDAGVAQMYATHRSDELARSVRVYCALLVKLLYGAPVRPAAEEAGRALGVDVAALTARGADDRAIIGRGVFSSACYISDSLPALLYLLHKYAGDPQAALVAQTNVGGENCHRVRAWAARGAWGSTGAALLERFCLQ
jgi:ADP-ribosyl-[dinitrogen reductase] hydrolase